MHAEEPEDVGYDRPAMDAVITIVPCHICGAVIWCTAFDTEDELCPHCGAGKLDALYLFAGHNSNAYYFFWDTITLQKATYFQRVGYKEIIRKLGPMANRLAKERIR